MVPNNFILPFVGIDFDSSRAFQGPATLPVTGLLIGQKLASGTGQPEEPILVTSADQVATLGGAGSNIHRQAIAWFENNRITDTYIIMLDDASTGSPAAAVNDIAFTGTATAVGSITLYIDGSRYQTAIANADDAATAVGKIITVVNADTAAAVTASLTSTSTLRLTAKNLGAGVGDVDIRFNYNAGEVFPAGLSAAATVTSTAGAVDPDIQDALDAMGDLWANVITAPYSDATALGKVKTELTSRASTPEQRDSMYYCARKDTRANLITFGQDANKNSQFITLIANSNQPASNSQTAARYAGQVAKSVQQDTAIPLHRLTLVGALPVPFKERWTFTERNQLAQAGIATLNNSNGVQTEATVTMYRVNSAGATDPAYQFQNTVFILMRLRYTFVQRILLKYSRAKLVTNADRIDSGQQVISPAIGRDEAIAWFASQERAGQVENFDQFKNDVICRRSASNVNRLEWILPPDLVNQFIVGTGDMQFLLETPAA